MLSRRDNIIFISSLFINGITLYYVHCTRLSFRSAPHKATMTLISLSKTIAQIDDYYSSNKLFILRHLDLDSSLVANDYGSM